MAISVSGAKLGMMVAVVPSLASATTAPFYKDDALSKHLYNFPKGKYIGKIIQVSTAKKSVKVQFPIKLKLGLLVYSSGWVNPANLGVVPQKDALPANVAEMKAMYVLSGKTDVLVRRSPVTGKAFAAVNGNQMVRVTGQEKQGYTEVVTDNGNGWIYSKFLTSTKPVTVVTPPQPSVQQEQQPPSAGGSDTAVVPGVVYVPDKTPSDNNRSIVTIVLLAIGAILGFKIFKKKQKNNL